MNRFFKRSGDKISVTLALLAVLSMVLSFFAPELSERVNHEASNVERNLHRRERLMDSYIQQAFDTPVDQWISFEDFPDDFVLYRYNSDTLQSWVGEFSISNDEVDVIPLWYHLHYMSNDNLYNTPMAYIREGNQYANLGSAWYFIKCIEQGYTKIIAGILIKNDYQTDNIKDGNSISRHLHMHKRYAISDLVSGSGDIVKSIDGTPLFTVVANIPSTGESRNLPFIWAALILLTCALIVFLRGRRTPHALIFTIFGLTVVYLLVRIITWYADPSSAIFSPMVYADSLFIDSFASLLFCNLYIFLIVASIFMVRRQLYVKFLKKGKTSRVIIAATTAMITACLIVYIHLTFSSLIRNSSISLNLMRITEISVYTIISYFSYSLLFIALLQMLQMTITAISGKHGYSIFRWRSLVIYIVVVSGYTLATVSIVGMKKEFDSNKVLTDRLSIERDLSLEIRLRMVEDLIANDQLIAMLSFWSQGGEDLIKNKILERYLYRGFNRNYNLGITICAPDSQLIIDRYTPPVGCFNFYQEELEKYGVQLAPLSHFFFMNNYKGNTSYLGVFSYINYQTMQTSRLFVEIESKYVNESIFDSTVGFVGQTSGEAQQLPKYYSYAKYTNCKLVSYSGNYNYPVAVEEDEFKPGFHRFISNGYTHYANNYENGEIIIVSREREGIFPFVIFFSYILIFYGAILIFASKQTRRKSIFYLPQHSFKRRFTVVMVVAITASLLCVGVGSVTYTYNRSVETIRHEMESKIQIVQSSISDHCLYAMRYTDINTPQLFDAMESVATNTQCDINLYDVHGKLIKSTRPEFFEQFLMGSRMNHQAYDQIVNRKQLRCITQESTAGTKYYSIYAPIFNIDGNLVAIANIPYISKSSQMQENAAFSIATIINLYLIVIIASLLLALMVANSFSRPITELRKYMENLDISAKKKHIVYKNSKDEIGILVEAYNKMTDDLERSTLKLKERERQQAWQEMARQIAHEIKNPLTPMRLSIQHMQRLKMKGVDGWENKFDSLSESLLQHIDILAETAGEFSSFAKFYNEEISLIDLIAIIKEQLVLFDVHDNIRMRFNHEGVEKAIISARQKQITRVFVNLISNAIQAIEQSECGQLDITLTRDDNNFVISIADNGPGVSDENIDKLFKPNFTTKSSGTGLGLAISRSIIEQSLGTICYETSATLGGACFIIKLPAAEENQ